MQMSSSTSFWVAVCFQGTTFFMIMMIMISNYMFSSHVFLGSSIFRGAFPRIIVTHGVYGATKNTRCNSPREFSLRLRSQTLVTER